MTIVVSAIAAIRFGWRALPAWKSFAGMAYPAPASGSAAPRRAASVVAVDEAEDAAYIASVTVQTVDPGNRTYAQDAQIIRTASRWYRRPENDADRGGRGTWR